MVRVLDAHVHLGESTAWLPYMDPTISAGEVIAEMDRHGIESAVVFPNPHVGDRYPALNDDILEAQTRYPDRLMGFGRVDPRRGKECLDEIRRCHDMGLAGLKLHPVVECFRPDHPMFEELFELLDDLDFPVLVHSGNFFASPGFVGRIIAKRKSLRVIFGHLNEGCIRFLMEYDHVYADTSACRTMVLRYAASICPDKLVFGSDFPYLDYKVQMQVVRSAVSSLSRRRSIFSKNLQRFLGL